MTNIRNRPIYIDELDTKSRTDRKWDLFRFIWIYFGLIVLQAVLRTRSTSVTKDELFSLEDSLAQAVFVSVMNARFVSVKQGIDFSNTPTISLSFLFSFSLSLFFIFSFLSYSQQMVSSLSHRCHVVLPPFP